MEPLTHLVVMSRAPLAGQTKTRLIPALGAEGARAFHVTCLQDVLRACTQWRQERVAQGHVSPVLHLAITPPDSTEAFRATGIAWPADARLEPQRGATLEARMEHALEAVRKGHPQDQALLIGCDLPLLRAAHLHHALRALETAPVVLGPAEDGGYYLVGLGGGIAAKGLLASQSHPGVPPLEAVQRNLRARGLLWARMDTLPDADTPEDLRQILLHPLARGESLSHSLRWLREHLPASFREERLPA
ncbi:MAG TPA: DUF2064 domain-containing protein [bacterium]|nr:DUF2064 domain-containing protein [bacterium]